MMILRTYARLFVSRLDDALPTLEALIGHGPDARFTSDDPKMLDAILDDPSAPPLGTGEVELALMGSFLVVAGDEPELHRARRAVGPVVVDDLEAVTSKLVALGARLAVQPTEAETGIFNFIQHSDGTLVEYIQWKPEVVDSIIGNDGQR
ncbi:hypothetical protein GCM10027570_27900 [Streptomonospora sediminis]